MSVVPNINQVFKNLSTSSTLRINQKIKQLKSDGVKTAHFGFGQSPFAPPELLQQSLAECANQSAYLPTQGAQALRDAIAKWMGQVFKIECTANQIFVGPGSKECLFDLLLLIEGTVLIPQGSWVSYKPITTILDKPVQILPTYENDAFCLTPEVLDQHCQSIDGPKILILNSPNNPTGQVYDSACLQALAVTCQKHNVIVISDEIYGLVQFESQPYASLQHYYPQGTIVTNGLSKAFSAGGYRLGFAVLPENFSMMYSAYNTLISETYSAVASPVQYAAMSVFSQYDKIKSYINCCNHIHRFVLEYTHAHLSKAGYSSCKPKGAFYLFAHLESHRSALSKLGIHTGAQLCDHILQHYGVAVLPASDFCFDESYLGFRLAPVDYDGAGVLPVFSSQEANSRMSEWFPQVQWGVDQLVNFVHSLNDK